MKQSMIRRFLCLLLTLVLVLCSVPSLADSSDPGKLYYEALTATRSTSALLYQFLANLPNGMDITVADDIGTEQGELGYRLRRSDPFLYLAGNILPEVFALPADAAGVNGDGLYLKKGAFSGLLPADVLAVAAGCAALGLDPDSLPTEKDLELLKSMLLEFGMGLAFLVPTPVQQSDGSQTLTLQPQELWRKVFLAARTVLSAHRAELDGALPRLLPLLQKVFPQMPRLTSERMIAFLTQTMEKQLPLPFTALTITWSESELSLATDQDFFSASLRLRGDGFSAEVILQGTTLLTAVLSWVENIAVLTAQTAGHSLLATLGETENGFALSLSADESFTANALFTESQLTLSAALDGTQVLTAELMWSRNGFSLTGTAAGVPFSVKLQSNGVQFVADLSANGDSLLTFSCDTSGTFHFVSNIGTRVEAGLTVWENQSPVIESTEFDSAAEAGIEESLIISPYLFIDEVPVFAVTYSETASQLKLEGSIASVAFNGVIVPAERTAAFSVPAFELAANLTWTDGGFRLNASLGENTLEAFAEETAVSFEAALTVNAETLCSFRLVNESKERHLVSLVLPGFALDTEIRSLSDGTEITGTLNGEPLSLTVDLTDGGFILTGALGKERFYGSYTQGGSYGFRQSLPDFSLILCHNENTLTLASVRDRTTLKVTGSRLGTLNCVYRGQSGEFSVILDRPLDRVSNGMEYWYQYEFSLEDRCLTLAERVQSYSGRTIGTNREYYLKIEDRTEIPSRDLPKMPDHCNVTAVSWYSPNLYPRRNSLLFVTDMPEKGVYRTTVSRTVKPDEPYTLFSFTLDYANNRWPFADTYDTWDLPSLFKVFSEE